MKRREIHQFISISPLLLLTALALACAGAAGPAANSGGPGGNAVGENPPAAGEVAFNPGSIQAGGEGHGQLGPKADKVVKVQTKDGRGNCGVPSEASQEIFPEGEAAPTLMSWASGNETGPFGAAATRSMGNFGRVAFPECPRAECPLIITIETTQVRVQMVGRFLKLVATYTDPSGKFFQSEPKVVPYRLECAEPPCEICLPLKEESEIAERDRVRREVPNFDPVELELPPLPAVEGERAPGLRFIDAPIDFRDFQNNIDFRK